MREQSNSPDEPSVLGAGCWPSPMPTEADYKAAYKAAYVAEFVKVGLDADTPAEWFDAADWEELKTMTPQEAAEAEMEYWTDD